MMLIARQGDIAIIESEAQNRVKNSNKLKTVDGYYVIAEGELTGHSHVIKASKAVAMYMLMGSMYLQAKEKTKIQHLKNLKNQTHEHDDIEIKPGWYELRRQKTYTPWGNRQVED